MTSRYLLALLGCLALAGCGGRARHAAETDQEAIRSTWRVERAEFRGKVVDAEDELRKLEFVFDEDKVLAVIGQVQHEGFFSLSPGRAPHLLDIKPIPGSKDKPLLGIYAFEGRNQLRICCSERSRPHTFATSASSDAVLLELKRTPPREAATKLTPSALVERCRRSRGVAPERSEFIQVTGEVIETQEAHLILAAGANDHVDCVFNRNYKSELERAAQVREGQKLTIRGTFYGFFDTRGHDGKFIQLANCEICEPIAGEK